MPCSNWLMTSLFSSQKNGCWPRLIISHTQTAERQIVISLFLFLRVYCVYKLLWWSVFLTKHPNVTGCGETSEVNGLWSHPLDGQPSYRRCKKKTKNFRTWIYCQVTLRPFVRDSAPTELFPCFFFTFVVLLLFYVPWQTKVSQLHTDLTGNQHVPYCNVSVNNYKNTQRWHLLYKYLHFNSTTS